MARAVMRIEGSELICFHANYVYMWKKLNTAPYYVCGFGESPSWINAPELLPSYVNLSKCMNPEYVPSINLVNKIVHFYNANIAPSIDTYTFLHELLELGDKGRTALTCASFDSFCGTYCGYYYSGIKNDQYIRGALLRLFESDGELRALAITDLVSDDEIHGAVLQQFLNSDNPSLEKFSLIRDTMPIYKRVMALFSGVGTISPGVITFKLRRTDMDGSFLSLYFPTSSVQNEGYLGGLGIAFLVTQDCSFQFFRVGIGRADSKDLCPISIDDPKLKELLVLRKGSNERVNLSPADNIAWTNYILFKELEKTP